MKLTTDNRPSHIAEDYFEEIQALRARMRELQSENIALRLENCHLRAAAGNPAPAKSAYTTTDHWIRRTADAERAA